MFSRCSSVPGATSVDAKPMMVLYLSTGSPLRSARAATLWPAGTRLRQVRFSTASRLPCARSMRATSTLSFGCSRIAAAASFFISGAFMRSPCCFSSSCRRPGNPVLEILAQLRLHEFAGRGTRQNLDEGEIIRHLPLGKMREQQFAQLARRHVFARLFHHHRERPLVP